MVTHLHSINWERLLIRNIEISFTFINCTLKLILLFFSLNYSLIDTYLIGHYCVWQLSIVECRFNALHPLSGQTSYLLSYHFSDCYLIIETEFYITPLPRLHLPQRKLNVKVSYRARYPTETI